MPDRLLEEATIEKNKDRTNLRSALIFVEDNLDQYKANVARFFAADIFPESWALAQNIQFANVDDSVPLQITPHETQALIAHIAPSLIRLSALKTIDFRHHAKVLVPNFADDGNLDPQKACRGGVPADEFVREADQYHPERILIGLTANDAQTIFPTAIPPTVSADPEAVRLYQLHVMLHELFHTIEMPRRNEQAAQKLSFRDSSGRTFADWSREYLESLSQERLLTSAYSSVYHDRLFDGNGNVLASVTPYDFALREDMAEAWVASHFDIISNPHGYTSFRSFPFGNEHPQQELLQHGLASRRAALMNELRVSEIGLVG